MLGCFFIVLGILLAQGLSLFNTCRNYKYALAKFKLAQSNRLIMSYRPYTALIVPCKGLDNDFDRNILSLYHLDYECYELFFVTESTQDPAYGRLQTLKKTPKNSSLAKGIHIWTAGQATTSTQKLHNQLHAYANIPDYTQTLAFADSDICVTRDWLSQLLWPLRKDRIGATSGYRWFIPVDKHWASLALAAVNAKVAQMLGNTRFIQAWGGSMAIRRDVFDQIGLKEIWAKAISDDYALTYAAKKLGYKLLFVPSCLVASHMTTAWKDLLELCKRQLLITRVSAAGTWWFGFASSLMSILGPWGSLGLTITSAMNRSSCDQWGMSFPWWPVWMLFTFAFFSAQAGQAWIRQGMIGHLFPDEVEAMKKARFADICFFWIWSFILTGSILASAVGRTICWRGIRYRLLGPTEVAILTHPPK